MGMFAAAKMAAASVSVIQSDATRGTRYWPVEADELETVELGAGSALPEVDPSPAEGALALEPSLPAEPSLPDESLPDESLPDESLPDESLPDESLPVSDEDDDDGSPSFFALAVRAALVRSFFAQPVPRNTIAGVDIAFLSEPPQTSQVVGPSAWMPCITSVRRPHCEQT
jgi:hypothetical protein